MSLKLLLFTLPLSLSCILHAQRITKDNGYIIYTLGTDTTALGHYQLKGQDFAMTIVIRTPSLRVSKLKGTFFNNGELQYAEGTNYIPVPGKDSSIISSKLYYARDTTFLEVKRGKNITQQKYPLKTMLANSLGSYTLVFMPPLLAHFAPKKIGDSVLSTHLVLGSARKFVITKVKKRMITTSSQVMGMFKLLYDNKGRLQFVDAIGSSWNLRGTLIPYLNMDSVIATSIKKEQPNQSVAVINRLDSVQTTINSTVIKIRYSRPLMRGRLIFGEVVPWNRVWRTGANAATKITISEPLYFDGKELPAGEYSIFTRPTQEGWTMMFNKEANIWGTEYNPEFDVLRISMKVDHLKEPVELMTIEVVSKGKSNLMNVIWEKLKASVSFTTKE